MKKLILVAVLLLVFFASCKVEFSPNAEWKDVPVVWCVLDQGDDTTWVRVQRCYLGEDNLYGYMQETDSVNYPQGSITVTLEKWKANKGTDNVLSLDPEATAPIDALTCECMLRTDKDTGLFAGGQQPVYFVRTANWLEIDCMYKLVICNAATGDTIATAFTQLVGLKYDRGLGDADLTTLEQPNVNVPRYRMFRFEGNPAMCKIRWKTLERGRYYQPMVRFFYYHQYQDANGQYHSDTSQRYSIDVPVPGVRRTTTVTELSSDLYESTFLSGIANAIRERGDNEKKGFCDTVDIFMTVCNEDLSAYMFSTEPLNTIVQDRVTYTNINDGKGVGVFAARRAHFRYRIPTNAESGPGTYHQKIADLNVGF